MRSARTSRYRRSTGCPRITPRPPQICTASSITLCADSVANIFAMAASRVTRVFDIPLPGRAVDEQRARVDARRHVGEFRLGHLELRQRLAEYSSLAGSGKRLLERPPGEPERSSAHRGAEDVEIAHRQLEPLSGFA